MCVYNKGGSTTNLLKHITTVHSDWWQTVIEGIRMLDIKINDITPKYEQEVLDTQEKVSIPRQKSSVVYKAFTIDGNDAICKKCHKKLLYTGPTSNLLKHVKVLHPEWFQAIIGRYAVHEDQNEEQNVEPLLKKRKYSLVYRGFNISGDNATCRYCNKKMLFKGNIFINKLKTKSRLFNFNAFKEQLQTC